MTIGIKSNIFLFNTQRRCYDIHEVAINLILCKPLKAEKDLITHIQLTKSNATWEEKINAYTRVNCTSIPIKCMSF